MAWSALIAGVEHKNDLWSKAPITVERRFNERGTARFTTRNGYLPAMHAEVLLYEQDGTTLMYGGVVIRRRMHGVSLLDFVDIECTDFCVFADWCSITATYVTPVTLKAVLEDLADVLAPYGVTLDAGQVTGPTLAAFSWTDKKVSDALRELTTRSEGYIWNLTPAKVLSMVLPGSDPAPWAITDGAPHCRELEWEEGDGSYATKVILTCGPAGTWPASQAWTTNGTAASWVTDLPASLPDPIICRIDGVLHTIGVGGTPEFTWDQATHTLALGSLAQPGAGHTLTLDYTAQGPFRVFADSAATPLVEYRASAPDITTLAPGQERADGLLVALHRRVKEIAIHECDAGLAPAQTLTIALTPRPINTTALVTSVVSTLISEAFWRHTANAIEGAQYQGSELDYFRGIESGGSSSGVISGGGGGGTVIALSSPFPLGGSRGTALGPAPAAWTPVVGWFPFVSAAAFSALVRVYLRARDAGIGVTARLYNVTDATAVSPTSGTITSQTDTMTTFTVALAAGKEYRLEILGSASGALVFGIGVLESL